jgi:hypothetical protein
MRNGKSVSSAYRFLLSAFHLWDKRNHLSVFKRATLGDAACFHNELRAARHFP